MQWTISNQLTFGRVAIIPVFIVVFYLPGELSYWLSSLLFVLAAITDWLDGYLARTRGEVTAFGRFLDPVADKLLVAAALVLLVSEDMAPAILAVIIIGREIAIGALREWLAEHATVVHVSWIGKWKTALQMIAISALLLHVEVTGVSMHDVGLSLLWVAAALTLWSGYDYMKDAWPELMSRPEEAVKAESEEAP
ncbi:CDP-diacylglycerol--glycerol-3-phosphate 3-phosphatidyltransferase [Mariprofundus ferrinatatus]|uniref:CDP-diacylglycerol--glycerol-3-phosphate 3-phosphatidyltransferase n=1 Tax=Mariprofundus ferrinatatus TaxID=1921087 RepID=A0A2K8LAJ1_9PROT|nr:CDP-diacylglycerol--glycerol-3-phosphate 3-phosphatidyltransferase [Mariprofundus ferrinatatus]ATX81964.1 CDP-diacylglycerol--glycerol-3-phosphate 3-phosphatidyltransferase [Mariprofundus ferrinatatus]